MKKIALAFSLVLISSSTFAAQFTNIPSMKNKELAAAQRTASKVLSNETIYGDASSVVSFKFTKDPAEKLLNSIKQLNIAKFGVSPGNEEDTSPSNFSNMGELINSLMDDGRMEDFCEALDEEAQKATCKADMKKMGGALKAALGESATTEIKIFDSGHCDEDGCWKLIDIVDVTNNQVLVLQRGYYGT